MRSYLQILLLTLSGKLSPTLELKAYYYFSDFVMYYKAPIRNGTLLKLVNIFFNEKKGIISNQDLTSWSRGDPPAVFSIGATSP